MTVWSKFSLAWNMLNKQGSLPETSVLYKHFIFQYEAALILGVKWKRWHRTETMGETDAF